MTLRIAPPDTEMAAEVLRAAQRCADLLDRTQFIVMERRTWERLMPNSTRDAMKTTNQGQTEGKGLPDSGSVAVPVGEGLPDDVRRALEMAEGFAIDETLNIKLTDKERALATLAHHIRRSTPPVVAAAPSSGEVEAVARALCASAFGNDFDDQLEPTKESYRAQARVAIAALRATRAGDVEALEARLAYYRKHGAPWNPLDFAAEAIAVARAAHQAPCAECGFTGDHNLPTAVDALELENVRLSEERDHLLKWLKTGLTFGKNKRAGDDRWHMEWHAKCGCAYHPEPFPHVHPCSDAHKRSDLHPAPQSGQAPQGTDWLERAARAYCRRHHPGAEKWTLDEALVNVDRYWRRYVDEVREILAAAAPQSGGKDAPHPYLGQSKTGEVTP